MSEDKYQPSEMHVSLSEIQKEQWAALLEAVKERHAERRQARERERGERDED